MAIPAQHPSAAIWDDSLFETVLAAAINGVLAINDQGLIRVFNASCQTMFQYWPEEVLGHGLHILLAPPYREEFEAHLRDFQRTGEAADAIRNRELKAQRKDGTIFPIFLSVREGMHQGRRIFVAVIQDLSNQELERAIHAEERSFLAAIVDSSNDAIVSKSLDGQITSWNRAAETVFGYSAMEMVGSPITRLIPTELQYEEDSILATIREGRAVEHYETIRICKDGRRIDVELTASPIRDSNGRVIGASKILRDITRQKESDARLQALSSELNHVARLTEMGQISAAIAHELNQPLSAIANYTNVAKRLATAGTNPDMLVDAVTKAADQAVRAGQIIRRLRGFVEKREGTRDLENINSLVEDSLTLGLIGTKSADIRTDVCLSDKLPLIDVDKVQIQQVLVNLLRNAVEAMAFSKVRQLSLKTADDGNGFIIVKVADTGSGISKEIAERLFSPFVTTKAGGMGIGLAISRSIIESHGGRLSMAPNPGGGTVFEFTLPAATRTVE
jgi:PAS domain S-box